MSRSKKVVLPESVLAKIGTDTDKAVAAAAGVDENAVFRARRAAGIPPFAVNKGAKYLWTPENELLLGTMSDAELGRRLGIQANNVCMARQRRGIPPYKAPPVHHPSPKLIEAARKRAGHTRKEAAAAAGLKTKTAAQYWGECERGEKQMSLDLLRRYMQTTGQIQSKETA